MSREWRPGDVAALRSRDGAEVRALWQGNQWATQNGHYLSHWQVAARPLVVIDAEDREQVERLRVTLVNCTARPIIDHELADALREYANPTTPKPAEPMGLGAVVEDAKGDRWVSWRSGLSVHDRPWQLLEMDTDEFRNYADISAVRVHFEGVTK